MSNFLPLPNVSLPTPSFASRVMQASQNIQGGGMQPPMMGGTPPMGAHPWANQLMMASRNISGLPTQPMQTPQGSPPPQGNNAMSNDPFIQMLQRLVNRQS